MRLFELLGSIVVNNREANENIEDTRNKAEDASSKIGKAFSAMGSGIAKGVGAGAQIAAKSIAAIGAAAATGVTAFLATAESTREYRQELAKLTNMAAQVGTSSDYIKDKWMSMSAVLGDEGAVTEGLNNIMAAGFTTQESIDGITQVLEGAALKWKDTLKFEGLADGLQETLAVGEATGSFAEMLERSGIVLDDFNAGLAACSTEAQKQDYIMKTLADTGLAEVSKAYRDANGDIINAEMAQAKLTDKIAQVGAVAEPIMTTLKVLAADLLDAVMPFVELIGSGLQGALTGSADAAGKLAEGLSGGIGVILDTIVGMLPTIISTLSSLVPAVLSSISDVIGQILNVISNQGPELIGLVLDILLELMKMIVDNAPLLVEAIVSLLNSLMGHLPEFLTSLITLVINLVTSLVEQLPIILPQLLNGVVSLINELVKQLPIILPILVQALISIFNAIVGMLPTLLPTLINLLISIVNTLLEQIDIILPMLIDSIILILDAIIEALPTILEALISALPVILQAVWDTIVSVFMNLPDWFGQLFQGAVDIIKRVFSVIETFFSSIWTNVKNVFAPVGNWFSEKFTAAKEGIKNAWSSVTGWFSEKWNGIKNTFSNVGGWFSEKFTDAWNKVKSAFSGFKSFFADLWDSIKNTFSSLGTKIGDAIGGAVKSGINGIIGMIESTINKGIGLINGAINLINEIPGVDIGKFSTVSLPRLAKGGVLYDETAFIGGEYANAATNPEIVTPQNIMAETFEVVLTDKMREISAAQNDRLDRILSLLADYIPQLGNQQIILDTGTLVGELVEPMDEALGERAGAKERNRFS